MSTFMAKPETVKRGWYVIDAAGKPLGRVAVKGMLPHNTIGRKSATRLKVYAGENHNQAAQKPVVVEL